MSKRISSDGFKLWVLSYVFCMTVFRLLETRLSEVTIVSDKVILGTVLFSLVYIWLQEVRDRQILSDANIKLLQKQEELKQTNIDTIASLIISEETKDPYTNGHSQRVTEYALKIAKKLGLPNADMEILERAGLLHDLGKIGISDGVLHKVEKLSQKEWDEIKTHPKKGANILTPLPFLAKEREIILHHHERFDGTGYPSGLKKEEIPLGARILSVADAYDAMNSQRPYRNILPKEKIREEIVNNAGIQFDPKIANMWVDLLRENQI